MHRHYMKLQQERHAAKMAARKQTGGVELPDGLYQFQRDYGPTTQDDRHVDLGSDQRGNKRLEVTNSGTVGKAVETDVTPGPAHYYKERADKLVYPTAPAYTILPVKKDDPKEKDQFQYFLNKNYVDPVEQAGNNIPDFFREYRPELEDRTRSRSRPPLKMDNESASVDTRSRRYSSFPADGTRGRTGQPVVITEIFEDKEKVPVHAPALEYKSDPIPTVDKESEPREPENPSFSGPEPEPATLWAELSQLDAYEEGRLLRIVVKKTVSNQSRKLENPDVPGIKNEGDKSLPEMREPEEVVIMRIEIYMPTVDKESEPREPDNPSFLGPEPEPATSWAELSQVEASEEGTLFRIVLKKTDSNQSPKLEKLDVPGIKNEGDKSLPERREPEVVEIVRFDIYMPIVDKESEPKESDEPAIPGPEPEAPTSFDKLSEPDASQEELLSLLNRIHDLLRFVLPVLDELDQKPVQVEPRQNEPDQNEQDLKEDKSEEGVVGVTYLIPEEREAGRKPASSLVDEHDQHGINFLGNLVKMTKAYSYRNKPTTIEIVGMDNIIAPSGMESRYLRHNEPDTPDKSSKKTVRFSEPEMPPAKLDMPSTGGDNIIAASGTDSGYLRHNERDTLDKSVHAVSKPGHSDERYLLKGQNLLKTVTIPKKNAPSKPKTSWKDTPSKIAPLWKKVARSKTTKTSKRGRRTTTSSATGRMYLTAEEWHNLDVLLDQKSWKKGTPKELFLISEDEF